MTLEALQQTLHYTFRDVALLRLALTHRSLLREGGAGSNQRLEFLGDAVLGLVIADMLYQLFPGEAEGDLSKRLVSLVNGERLAIIAQTMQLGDCMMMSSGEEDQGGRQNPSNLEDACEALLGAIYLDGGLDAARGVIHRFWQAQASATGAPPKDAKTALQEWAQGRGLKLPEYVLISSEGPSHAPLFVVEVRVSGLAPVRAEAGVKKTAERLGAEKMLASLN
ncbi:MAG: ribonuclease III [Alphaproteobacteria bacterium]|nr:ribonuclease III [Alphaproteobacteria bacterium]